MQSITASNGYLMMVPQTLSSNSQVIVKTKIGETFTFNLDGQVWKAGDKINYQLDLTEDAADISIEIMSNSFIGAFWRYNETGERIIRMPNTGTWEVFVLNTDGQWALSDILLDTLPDSYSTTQGVAINGNIQQITNPQTIIRGTGNISFRIGLNGTLASSETEPKIGRAHV